jgi:type VI secretion system protein ImpD
LFDYDVCPKPSKDHPFDDIATLRSISQVGAAAFAPCFLNASPTLLGIDEFDELTQTLNVEAVHEKADFIKWRDFRDTEDSRFISLALPRILMRQPYRFEPCEEWGFAFREKVHSRKDYLWGGAVYGVGEVLIRSFGETGWFAKIKGWSRGEATGGLVLGPARDAQPTESLEVSGKPITETLLGDSMEKQLNRLGLMAICPLKLSSYAAFLSAPSVQKPRTFATAEASANAEISSMTNYLLCASRFAHCIRLMAREKIGSVTSEEALQQDLSNWLVQYKSVNDDPSLETRADKPLLDARVEVTPKPGRPGEYDCVIWLQPIHGFDDVRATLKLETQLSGKR